MSICSSLARKIHGTFRKSHRKEGKPIVQWNFSFKIKKRNYILEIPTENPQNKPLKPIIRDVSLNNPLNITQILRDNYIDEYESLKKRIRVSDRIRILGPNTEKRLVRWAQYNKIKPTKKDTDKFEKVAKSINELYEVCPHALQDIIRQASTLNWATRPADQDLPHDGIFPPLITPESLWLLVHYGNLNHAPSEAIVGREWPAPEILPNIHKVSIEGKCCQVEMLKADHWTIYKHYNAALDTAYQEVLSILSSNKPEILKLWHHNFRNDLKPDYSTMQVMINKKAFGTFYCLNGERIYLPHHIGEEIISLIKYYTHELVLRINSKNAAQGIENVGRPVLRDELRYIEKWPDYLDAGTRKKNLEKKYKGEFGMRDNSNNNNFLDSMGDDWAPNPDLSFDFQEDSFMDSNIMFTFEDDISAVTGIDWNVVGNYRWAAPDPDCQKMIITHRDFEFEELTTKYDRTPGRPKKTWAPPNTPKPEYIPEDYKPGLTGGLSGQNKSVLNQQKTAIFSNIKRIKEFHGVQLKDNVVYRSKQLQDWGWTSENLKSGVKTGLLEQPKMGQYIIKFIDSEEYTKWRKEQDILERRIKVYPQSIERVLKSREILNIDINSAPFQDRNFKKKVELAKQEVKKGKDLSEALKIAEEHLNKTEVKEAPKTVTINKVVAPVIGGLSLEALEEKRDKMGLTESEKNRLRLLKITKELKSQQDNKEG